MNDNQIDPWAGIGPGTLTDATIKGMARVLFTEEFDAACVKQACYELRASKVGYETLAMRENKRIEIPDSGYILSPRGVVTVIVKEAVVLPPNMLARIMTKGQLLSIGIQSVNTYADPGFRGRLGITLCNLSNRYIRIMPNERIAKIEFVILPKAVAVPYSGQHGYETEIWPVPTHMFADEEVLIRTGVIRNGADEIGRIHGSRLGELARRVEFYEKRVWIHIGIMGLSFAGLFALFDKMSFLMSIITGVVANVMTGVASYLIVTRRRKQEV